MAGIDKTVALREGSCQTGNIGEGVLCLSFFQHALNTAKLVLVIVELSPLKVIAFLHTAVKSHLVLGLLVNQTKAPGFFFLIQYLADKIKIAHINDRKAGNGDKCCLTRTGVLAFAYHAG